MNNLHRDLAPVSDAAWAQIEEEARRTFIRNLAGRRVVDTVGPEGFGFSAVGTGHVREIESADPGVSVHQRLVQPLIELRVPFTVTREAVDDVERGAEDSDWQPVKDAARAIALAEDRTVFSGLASAGIGGIAPGSSNPPVILPERVQQLPDAVSRALSTLRLQGVEGPYSLLLSSDLFTAVDEETDHGSPVRAHLERQLRDGGQIIWAPALDGALLVSQRGGDYELHLGQDLSIGYLSHDAHGIRLYLQETLTFLAFTAEASVVLPTGL